MKHLFFLLVAGMFSISCYSQNQKCGQAVNQLQQYANQVNEFYRNEYFSVIPGVRCPTYNQWGQMVHPQIVQNCRLQMLGYLNQWYGIQCQYVNNWYAQIVKGCSAEPPSRISKPAPSPTSGTKENQSIDTEEIEELTAGIDEDKALKITIPKTASGYRPKN